VIVVPPVPALGRTVVLNTPFASVVPEAGVVNVPPGKVAATAAPGKGTPFTVARTAMSCVWPTYSWSHWPETDTSITAGGTTSTSAATRATLPLPSSTLRMTS